MFIAASPCVLFMGKKTSVCWENRVVTGENWVAGLGKSFGGVFKKKESFQSYIGI